MTRRFWLVQRLSYRPKPKDRPETPLEQLGAAFGGGRLNDNFTFDYMGAAEFEFGAIPAAIKAMQEGGSAEYERRAYGGVDIDMLWLAKDGDPWFDWIDWVEAGMRSKERPYEMEYRLAGTRPSWWDADREWETALYWSLDDNVIWSFADDGQSHLETLLGVSFAEETVE